MSSERPSSDGSEEAPARPTVPAADLPELDVSEPGTDRLPNFPQPGHDPRAITDAIRPDSGLALSPTGAVVLLRHADVVVAAHDAETYSSQVSRRVQLPNGLDGVEHTAYRQLIDQYFTTERMVELEPVVREVARGLCAELTPPSGSTPGAIRCDAVPDIGARFAVRAQTRWLGWPGSLEPQLLEWMAGNQAATRSGRPGQTAEVARRFDEIVGSLLQPRRSLGDQAPEEVTTELMRDESLGRPLRDEELESVIRNWTGDDPGSIALCVGVVCHHLATDRELQDHVRSGVSRTELAAIVDETLRIDDPFVANRRVTACPVTAGGVELSAGQRVVLNWTSANPDEQVFGDPDTVDPADHAESNLVYRTGRHVCPGRRLATVELYVLVGELTAAFADIALAGDAHPERSATPVGGFASVSVVLTPNPLGM